MSFTRPLNTILASGEPIIEELVCDTSTNCFPRRLVKKGTTGDTSFNVCTDASDNPIGFLDVSHKRGIGDYYRTGEAANVLQGPCVVVAETDASGNITKEDRLIADLAGKVKKGDIDASLNKQHVGIAKESVTYTGAVLPILVKSLLCAFMMLGTGKKRRIG